MNNDKIEICEVLKLKLLHDLNNNTIDYNEVVKHFYTCQSCKNELKLKFEMLPQIHKFLFIQFLNNLIN